MEREPGDKGSVAWHIAEYLASQDVAHVFGVPGETSLGLLSAIDRFPFLRYVATRHEEGAVAMADATARITHSVGVAILSRGPGLAHGMIGLHTARQDSVPLVAVVGQVDPRVRGCEAFQEVDVLEAARPWVKHTLEPPSPTDVMSVIIEAFETAESGRPGPVLVSMPSGYEMGPVDSPPPRSLQAPSPRVSPDDVRAVASAIRQSQRPIVVAGELVLRQAATPGVVELVDRIGCGVYTSWRNPDAFPATHPNHLGNLPWLSSELLAPLRNADLVITIGSRMDEMTTLSYTIPTANQTVVVIHPEPSSCGAAAESQLVLRSPLSDALPTLLTAIAPDHVERPGWLSRAHDKWIDYSTPPEGSGSRIADVAQLFSAIDQCLDDRTIVTCDAGSFARLVHRYVRRVVPGTFLGPMSGAMGYAVPAAVGARLSSGSTAVAFCGDGGFAMTMSELATAAHNQISRLVCVVFDNGGYGAISHRLSQDLHPGLTQLSRIDVAAAARSLGVEGVAPKTYDAFAQALTEALHAEHPVVIHLNLPQQSVHDSVESGAGP